MVLSSQSPRDGLGRRHMVSKKRSGARWPWIVVVLVGCAMGGLWLWSGGDAADPANAATADAGDAAMGESASSVAAQPAATTTPAPQPTPILNLDTPRHAPIAATPTPPSRTSTAPAASSTNTPPPAPNPTVDREAMPAVPSALINRSNTSAGADPARAADPRFSQGMGLIAEGQVIEGRRVLSRLLLEEGRTITPGQAQTIRDTLASVNKKLVFSPDYVPGDPLAEQYTIQPGDLLVRLAPRYKVPYPFIEQINSVNASRLRVGQKLKMINGPFHARVVKREYRLDIFANGPDGMPLYICSFPVGLGEFDSTPEGKWIVERNRKVANPAWADPRSGLTYGRDDPRNPIGEYWIALEGADDATRGLQGYGIHGTIEPESIGTQASMGCIRLRADDIKLVYAMLTEGESTVQIVR